MRLLRFETYAVDAVPLPIQAQAWQILWLSVNNYPAGNKEQTAIGHQLFLALRDSSIVVGSVRTLNPDGADVYLEDAEFRILDQAVAKFRENVNLSGAEALIWIDRVLDKAPQIAKEAYKAGERLND